jgi:hypothetical protein
MYGLDTFVPADAPQGSAVFPIYTTDSNFTGGLLLSSEFVVDSTQTLDVSYTVATAGERYHLYEDIGFAALLQNGIVTALLGAVRPDGSARFGDLAIPQSYVFPLPSPGVAYTYTGSAIGALTPFQLGGIQYGIRTGADQCDICATTVHSSMAVGPGTYQLLFGAFGDDPDLVLAVTSATVPEPGTLVLISCGMLTLVRARTRFANSLSPSRQSATRLRSRSRRVWNTSTAMK